MVRVTTYRNQELKPIGQGMARVMARVTIDGEPENTGVVRVTRVTSRFS